MIQKSPDPRFPKYTYLLVLIVLLVLLVLLVTLDLLLSLLGQCNGSTDSNAISKLLEHLLAQLVGSLHDGADCYSNLFGQAPTSQAVSVDDIEECIIQ